MRLAVKKHQGLRTELRRAAIDNYVDNYVDNYADNYAREDWTNTLGYLRGSSEALMLTVFAVGW
ncbi:hypothetical protein AAKU67_002431 [Oxalobacteraceae bacterium GrIS 2.11]